MNEEQDQELHQYLTFSLGREIFGLDITSVRELLDQTTITRIPKTPDFMRGVINLRGHAVPVVDLRIKFGMAPTVFTVDTCIIVIEVELEGEMASIGALADAVQEVFEIPPDNIDDAPNMGTAVNPKYIKGMGKKDNQFIVLLSTDNLFTIEELTLATAHQNDGDAAAA